MEKNQTNGKCFTLITGASAGIGKAVAEACAELDHNLFLVALPGSGLQEVCSYLENRYGVCAKYLCIDLREKGAPVRIYERALREGITVNFLVNNAGIGHAGAIEEHTQEEIDDMIMLNIRALTSLTRLFMPMLKGCPTAHILNVSSFVAFVPAAHKSVYVASKSYVYYFSESLRSELNGGPVRVSTLMPGPVYTNDRVRKRIGNNGFVSRATALEPEEVAHYAIPRVMAGIPVIIPGNMNRTVRIVLGALPYVILVNIMKQVFVGKGR